MCLQMWVFVIVIMKGQNRLIHWSIAVKVKPLVQKCFSDSSEAFAWVFVILSDAVVLGY